MNEDLVIKKLIFLEEEVKDVRENMATKDDFREVMTKMDKMTVILERLDQERILHKNG